MITSRERVLQALNHQQPDRVPVDLGGHRSSGMMAIAYARLKRALGITSGDIYVYDIVQQLAVIEQPVLDLFGVDTIELGRGFDLAPSDWRPWVLPDGTPCKIPAFIEPRRLPDGGWGVFHADGTLIGIQQPGCLYFEQACFPLLGYEGDDFSNLPAHLEKVIWSAMRTPPTAGDNERLRAGARALRASTDRAIIGLFGGNLLEIGEFLFRNDGFLYLLAAEPARAHRFLDALLEMHLANLETFLANYGTFIDIIAFGDDLGMQTGPMISPAMYREFFFPRHRLLWQTARKLANVKVMLHSCGGIYPLLPMLIEAGLDAVNPVQTTCQDMQPERLKREFGRDLTFWGGGCDTREVLPHGTPAQVADDVRSRIEILAPGGGFVFQQIHNIMADVPPENVVAMLRAVNPT